MLPGIDLVNTRNRGVAFGLFSEGGALLAIVAAVALAGLLVFFVPTWTAASSGCRPAC